MLQTNTPSLSILILLGVTTYISTLLLRVVLDPQRAIPGPLLARFTRFWYFFAIYKGDFEYTEIELHRRYGPVVRIAPGEYSIDDVEAARTIYGHGNAFVKACMHNTLMGASIVSHALIFLLDPVMLAPWYSAWELGSDPDSASLFSELDPARHSAQRRKFSSWYSMSSLIGYEPFVNNCSALLIQRFREIAASNRTIDLLEWLQCYAFDVVGEITFGKNFGFLEAGGDEEGVFQAIDTKGIYSTFVGIFPWAHKFLYPMLPSSGGQTYVINWTLGHISSKHEMLKNPDKETREGPPDIMTKSLQAHEENPQRITRNDIMITCASNIGAGSDTTAITLSSIFYHLMKHPETCQRLQDEIDTAAREGRVSDPVTFKEAQDLPYLQAVIKEAIRLHPATGLPLSRVVPAQGCTIADNFIPGNSTVGINPWVAHRNSSVFGTDAQSWRPERWIEFEDQGRSGEVDKYFLGFGMGSRTCIGKNISLLEMSTLVPQLVRRFEFVLDEATQERKGGGMVSLNRLFVKPQGLRARIVERKRSSV